MCNLTKNVRSVLFRACLKSLRCNAFQPIIENIYKYPSISIEYDDMLGYFLMQNFLIFKPKQYNYNHRNFIDTTQIAYLNLAASFNNSRKEKSVTELFQGEVYREEYDRQVALLKSSYQRASMLDVERIKRTITFINSIERGDDPFSSWKVVSVHDTNAANGFYACVISPDPSTAIVSFRGSESNTKHDLKSDWIAADLGLLTGDVTAQQMEAQKYIEEITEKFSKRFKRFFLSGHSLGGNLAEHALYTAPFAFRHKVICCYSFDAPGFAQNYFKNEVIAHGIAQTKQRVKKFSWSLVGGLLKATVPHIFVKSELDNNKSLNAALQRHATQFLIFENNNLVEGGNPDLIAKRIDELSEKADMIPSKVKEYLLNILLQKM